MASSTNKPALSTKCYQHLKNKLLKQAVSKTNANNPKKTPPPASVWQNPLHFIACGFGSGALPWVPGTWGTGVGILFFLCLSPLSLPYYLAALLLLTCFGSWISDITAKDFGVHDHTSINFDEIIGYLVTMIAIPATLNWIIAGFILFRIFDIWKPWPICYIDDKVHGGFGMLLDDIVAGLVSWLCLQAGLYYFT